MVSRRSMVQFFQRGMELSFQFLVGLICKLGQGWVVELECGRGLVVGLEP